MTEDHKSDRVLDTKKLFYCYYYIIAHYYERMNQEREVMYSAYDVTCGCEAHKLNAIKLNAIKLNAIESNRIESFSFSPLDRH